MRLYTVQTVVAWEAAQQRGYLCGDPAFSFVGDDDRWERAYRWMTEQMAKRLPAFSGDLPVWAWVERPDLRTYYVCRFVPSVLLTIDVPGARCLVSDFDAWHSVLDDRLLTATEAEFERSYDSATEAEKLASWQRVFDFERHSDAERYWLGDEADIDKQVCVDRVFVAEVKQVRPINRRSKDCGATDCAKHRSKLPMSQQLAIVRPK